MDPFERSRRDLMCAAAKCCLGVSVAGLAGGRFALAAPPTGKAKRVIYLFMDGAMSHLDTFDPKPSTSSQGATEPVATTLAGIKFGNHFPRLAKLAGALAVVRSLSTETGAHEPGRYLMRTSYPVINSIRHPALGAWMLQAGFRGPKELPANILIGADNDHPMAGFLPPGLAPVPIGDPTKGLENAKKPGYLSDRDFNHRMSLTNKFDRYFRQRYQGPEVQAYNQMYRDAIRLMGSEKLAAFNIKAESDAIRSAYGMNRFGQGCLLARRLIEEGVPCVDVNYNGWDMHNGLYEKLGKLGPSLDQGLSALLTDLHTRGLLESTLVVLATEFGPTPSINEDAGRGHHPGAFSCLLAGAGVRTGQVYGASDEKGFGVADQPVSIADFNATIATALGLSTTTEYTAPNGRPFKIANQGQPVAELLA